VQSGQIRPRTRPLDTWHTVLVTGAAGGIGGATTRILLAKGVRVVGVDLDPSVAVLEGGDGYEGVVADVTSEEDLSRLARRVADPPPPAHLILAAGGALQEEVDAPDGLRLPVEVFRRSVEVNLVGQYLAIKHLTPALAASSAEDRSITVVSSINAVGDFGLPAYSAAKAGLSGLVAALAVPLGRLGVRINAVAFGTVLTDQARELHRSDPAHFSQLAGLSVLDRLMSTEEAAKVLVALAEDLRPVTGTVLTADFGQSVPGRHGRLLSPGSPAMGDERLNSTDPSSS
jgi:NAD(P)-dependent dehydrogenase (short-subunit alcohol dehydrogenase family)